MPVNDCKSRYFSIYNVNLSHWGHAHFAVICDIFQFQALEIKYSKLEVYGTSWIYYKLTALCHQWRIWDLAVGAKRVRGPKNWNTFRRSTEAANLSIFLKFGNAKKNYTNNCNFFLHCTCQQMPLHAIPTLKDRAVVLQWRLIAYFNEIVIISTFPDTPGDVRHITPTPPVVWCMHHRVDAIRISTINNSIIS